VDAQRLSIRGCIVSVADASACQAALASVHDGPERPRCQCVPGGVEMYVAFHRRYVAKRMPETGSRHHPACPSYEPGPQQSGRGELARDAVLERDDGSVELRVAFSWCRQPKRSVSVTPPRDSAQVTTADRCLSLRGLAHFLLERAGFNRWSPAMAGKRNQAVLHKYLHRAAEQVTVKGVALSERFYVPEPFSQATRAEVAQRRRARLRVLTPRPDGQTPLALLVGELKGTDAVPGGRRFWIRHMPDTQLFMADATWQRFAQAFAAALEAPEADQVHPVRLLLVALLRSRLAYAYEIDTATLLMLSEHWIPIEGLHELALLHVLVEQQRRFIKPLRYDADSAAAFANALLLDTGAEPTPLHLLSPFMTPKERSVKERVLRDTTAWRWSVDEAIPALPATSARSV
jgi:hypothetical protein